MSQYTSREEFDLEKRVHVTNEIPPYDMYDALNSTLQNDLWKWVLGYSTIEFGLPYATKFENTSGDVSYQRNIDSAEVYYKMTNGEESPVYGPKASPDAEGAETHYHRMEIDGVLLPEFDFLLHEVYRYLDTQYPDHPDYNKLLTQNEIDDYISAAASVIDYKPDNKFFNKVAESLTSNLAEQQDEALMMKIRNLRNEAFRRKLYGSKAGYRMLANDIFQSCTIFPVATYLPLENKTKVELETEYDYVSEKDNFNKDHGTEYTKAQIIEYYRQQNRVIDTYSPLYYRKFRLIDWNGENSSYPQAEKTSREFYSLSLPFHNYMVYEYPAVEPDYSNIADIQMNDFYVNENDVRGTCYVASIPDPLFPVSTVMYASTDTNDKVKTKQSSETKQLNRFSTTLANAPQFSTYYKYPKFADIEIALTDYDSLKTNYPYIGNNQVTEIGRVYLTSLIDLSTVDLIAAQASEVEILINPMQDGTLFVQPSETVKYYPTEVRHTHSSSSDTDVYEFMDADTLVWDGCILQKEDMLANKLVTLNDTDLSNTLAVSNFTKGFIEMEVGLEDAYKQARKLSYELQGDNRYAFVINNSNNDKVVVLGNLSKKETYVDGVGHVITSERLNITAIPEVKDRPLMRFVYGEEFNKPYDEIYGTTTTTGTLKPITLALENRGLDDFVDMLFGGDDTARANAITVINTTNLRTDENFWNLVDSTDANFAIIENMKKNREFLYESANYITSTGEIKAYEKTLVFEGCRVEKVLRGAHSALSDGLRAQGVANPETYTVYSHVSDLVSGTISDLSFGCVNVVPLTDGKNFPDKFSIEYEAGIPSDTTDFYVKHASRSLDDTSINFLQLNLDMLEHDIVYIKNPLTELTYERRRNYNELPLSKIQDTLVDSLLNKPYAGYENAVVSKLVRSLVKIESVIDITKEGAENIISFESDLARELFKTLSVGDIITGPSVDSDDNDVYITYIGDNYCKVNQNFQQSGTFVLSYNIKMDIVGTDISENMSEYKKILDKNGLYEIVNPFEHGLWPSKDWPKVSNAILEGLPDISFFNVWNYRPKENTKSAFEIVMHECREVPTDAEVLLPSTIKFMNELFVELNINKLISLPNRLGKSPTLMNVEWLDYLTNSLTTTARATDNVSVGTNLMMQTDTTGFMTLISGQTYTDPETQVRFITMNLEGTHWPEKTLDAEDWVVPRYAQLGTGGSGRDKWFKNPSDISYPNVWGNNVYDGVIEGQATSTDEAGNSTPGLIDTLEANRGELKKRSVWASDGIFMGESEEDLGNSYIDCEYPVFEVPLGEYDTQVKYMSDANASNVLTTVQVSFHKQVFENLTKYIDNELKINSTNTISNECITQHFDIVENPDMPINSNQLEYGGDWVPTSKYSDGVYSVNYPASRGNDTITYYTIWNSVTLTGLTEKDESGSIEGKKSFPAQSLLFVYDTTVGDATKTTKTHYDVFEFNCINCYGEGTPDVAKYVYPPGNNFTLADTLLHAWAASANAFSGTELNNINKLTISELRDYFKTTHHFKTATLKNSINWFICTKWPEKKDTSYLGNVGIKTGDMIGFVQLKNYTENENYIGGTILSLKFNRDCKFISSLPVTRYYGCDLQAFNVITGNKRYVGGNGIGMADILTKNNFFYQLPRSYITPGSFKFNFILDPKYISTGYKYEDDGTTIVKALEVEFDTTKGSIYYDDLNDAFFTYSNILKKDDNNDTKFEEETSKIAIKFNEQKFFKNVTYVTGSYQVVETLEKGKTVTTKVPRITEIQGLSPLSGSMLPEDRILEVVKASFRSVHAKSLESTMFSNYTDIEGTLKGITQDGKLVVSSGTDNDFVTKANFAISLKALDETQYDYNEETNTYSKINKVTPDETTFDADNRPLIVEPVISRPLSSDTPYFNSDAMPDLDFRYYKNNLITTAKLDLARPSVLLTPDANGDLFNNALSKLAVGDTVSGIAVISGNVTETPVQLKLTRENGSPLYSGVNAKFDLLKAYAYGKRFIAVSKTGEVWYNNDINLAIAGGTIPCKEGQLNYNNLTGLGSMEVLDVSYNTDASINDWIFELGSEENVSQQYKPQFGLESEIPLISIFGDEEVYTYTKGNNAPLKKADIEKDEQTFADFETSVIVDLTPQYTFDNGEQTKVPVQLFKKDMALVAGNLTYVDDFKGTTELSLDTLNMDVNVPYFDMKKTSSGFPVNDFYSPSKFVADGSGTFKAFTSGRNLFIKSPTAIATKTDFGYAYTGDKTQLSYWKKASVPLMADKLLIEFRGMPDDEIYAYVTGVKEANLGTKSSTGVFEFLKADKLSYNALKMFGLTTEKFKRMKAMYENFIVPYGDELVDFTTFKDYLNNQESTDFLTFTRTVDTEENGGYKYTITMKNFDIVTKTYMSNLNSARMVSQDVAEFGADKSYEITFWNTDAEIEYGYQMFMFTLAKYLYGDTSYTTGNLTGAIKDAFFTDEKLYLVDENANVISILKDKLSKVEDIEDVRNWIQSAFPLEYTFTHLHPEVQCIYSYADDEGVVEMFGDCISSTFPIFEISSSYIDDKHIIYGGSILSKKALTTKYLESNVSYTIKTKKDGETDIIREVPQTTEELDATEIAKLNEILKLSKWENCNCPFILYSRNGGQDFSTIDKLCDTVGLENGADTNGSIYISAITSIDNTYEFYKTKVDTSAGTIALNKKFVVALDAKTGSHDFDAFTFEDVEEGQKMLATSYQVDYPKYKLIVSPGESYVHIASKVSVAGFGSTVEEINPEGLTMSEPTLNTDLTGTVEVLVSFVATEDVVSPYDYLNTNRLDKFMEEGDLIVPEYTEVDGPSTANRMFSYREQPALSAEISEGDVVGYPSLAEDTDHIYYEYTTYDEDDTTYYTPVTLQNGFGNNIKLCSSDGGALILERKGSELGDRKTFESFFDRATNNVEIYENAMTPMYETLADADKSSIARRPDVDLDISQNANSVVLINKDTLFPRVEIESTSFLDGNIRDYLFSNNAEDVEMFKAYLRSLGATSVDISLDTESLLDDVDFNDFDIPTGTFDEDGNFAMSSEGSLVSTDDEGNETKSKYLITDDLSLIDSLSSSEKTGRYVYKVLPPKTSELEPDENGNYKPIEITAFYIFDTVENMFILKNKRVFSSKVLMPYTFSGTKTYNNKAFSVVSREDAPVEPITGVYIPAKGYGGERSNKDKWVNTLPWLIDHKAFTDEPMKNSVGDYVYLTNKVGTRIISNESEFPCTSTLDSEELVTHTLPVSSFRENEKILTLYNDTSKKVTFTLIDEEPIQIYTPLDFVGIGAQKFSVRVVKNGECKEITEDNFKVFAIVKDDTTGEPVASREDIEYTLDVKNGILNITSIGKQTDIISIRLEYTNTSTKGKDICVVTKDLIYNGEIAGIDAVIDNVRVVRKVNDVYSHVAYDFTKGKEDRASNFDVTIGEGGVLTVDSLSVETSIVEYNSYNGNKISFSLGYPSQSYDVPFKCTYKDEALEVALEVALPVFDMGSIDTFWTLEGMSSEHTTYFNDVNITDKVQVERDEDNGLIRTLKYFKDDTADPYDLGKITIPEVEDDIYVTANKMATTLRDGDIEYSIYSKDSKKDLLVKGGYGPVVCHTPVYENLKELLKAEDYTINNSEVLLSSDIPDVSYVADDFKYFHLKDKLNIEGYNDGEEHHVLLKVLTQKTIPTQITTVNDKDAYVAIELSDITKFPPDRVWCNPEGYPASPVTIGNKVFNVENNYIYTNDPYVNNNKSTVYQCDEDGKIIGYRLDGEKLNPFVLTKTNRLSDAFVPLTPMYESCQDWFKNEFYLKGQEKNPFWQVINITSNFDSTTKDWVQEANLLEYNKSTGSMVLNTVPDADKICTINRSPSYEMASGSYTVEKEAEYVNTETGVIRMLMTQPAEKYRDTDYFVKFGITAKNPFKGSKVWNGEQANISAYLESSYTVNSRENLANKKDKDSAIVQATELGLFNKKHELIAYATFPPIEYRSDTQHVSFTCYIKNGALTPPAGLN